MINASAEGNAHILEKDKTYINFIPGFTDIEETETWPPVNDAYLTSIDSILNNYKEKSAATGGDPLHLMLFVHGGLNTFEASVDRVNKQYRKILKDGTYPIFVNWRSGPFTTYKDHLFRIRDGQVRPVHAKITAPFYFLTDLLGWISKIPEAWVEQGGESYADTFARDDELTKSFVVDDSPLKLSYPTTSDIDERPVGDSIVKGSVWAITSPVKLFTTSAAYAFGKPAWDIMIRRTRELLIRSEEFQDAGVDYYRMYDVGDRQELLLPKNAKLRTAVCQTDERAPVCSGALSVLVKKLRAEISKCNRNGKCSVTIIGHSMGAMVVAELLKYFQHVTFDNIVFMGAALPSRDALSSLIPYMQKNDTTKFYNLSLHPHAEDTETNFGGTVPNGSLLTWIDSMYGLPENELDRMFGRWTNARTVARLIPDNVAERFHFRVFGFDKENEPVRHGDFDRYDYWQPEFWGVGRY